MRRVGRLAVPPERLPDPGQDAGRPALVVAGHHGGKAGIAGLHGGEGADQLVVAPRAQPLAERTGEGPPTDLRPTLPTAFHPGSSRRGRLFPLSSHSRSGTAARTASAKTATPATME